MARPKAEIKVIRGKRLKQICLEQGINQIELYKKTGISQQAISKMVQGQANVTETTAEAVIKLFPQYRIEWLMGYDDFKTNGEMLSATISQVRNEGNLLFAGLSAFAQLTDYQIELTSPAHGPNENSAPIENWVKMVRDGYTIHHGDKSVQLTLEEMNTFENEVCDFVELKLKHLFRQKGDKNNG